jgi:hypothetical protein
LHGEKARRRARESAGVAWNTYFIDESAWAALASRANLPMPGSVKATLTFQASNQDTISR